MWFVTLGDPGRPPGTHRERFWSQPAAHTDKVWGLRFSFGSGLGGLTPRVGGMPGPPGVGAAPARASHGDLGPRRGLLGPALDWPNPTGHTAQQRPLGAAKHGGLVGHN